MQMWCRSIFKDRVANSSVQFYFPLLLLLSSTCVHILTINLGWIQWAQCVLGMRLQLSFNKSMQLAYHSLLQLTHLLDLPVKLLSSLLAYCLPNQGYNKFTEILTFSLPPTCTLRLLLLLPILMDKGFSMLYSKSSNCHPMAVTHFGGHALTWENYCADQVWGKVGNNNCPREKLHWLPCVLTHCESQDSNMAFGP